MTDEAKKKVETMTALMMEDAEIRHNHEYLRGYQEAMMMVHGILDGLPQKLREEVVAALKRQDLGFAAIFLGEESGRSKEEG